MLYSSVTKKPIGNKKIVDLDLFKRPNNRSRIEYYIYKEEEEEAVLTVNLSL